MLNTVHTTLRLRKLNTQQSPATLDLCLRETGSYSTLKWKPAFKSSSGFEWFFEKFCFSWRISLHGRPNRRLSMVWTHGVDAADYRIKWLVLFSGVNLLSHIDSMQQKYGQIQWTIMSSFCYCFSFLIFIFHLQIEAKVLLSRFLQTFKFSLVPGQSRKVRERITIRPKDGVMCTLTKRH